MIFLGSSRCGHWHWQKQKQGKRWYSRRVKADKWDSDILQKCTKHGLVILPFFFWEGEHLNERDVHEIIIKRTGCNKLWVGLFATVENPIKDFVEVLCIVLLLLDMLLYQICPMQMFHGKWINFISKVSVIDGSFDSALTKKDGSKDWEMGRTQRHFGIFLRRALYDFWRQMLFGANLVRNLGEGFNCTCESKIRCTSAKTREGLLFKLVELASTVVVSSQVFGTTVGMKMYWRSPALLMPLKPAILLPFLVMLDSSFKAGQVSQSLTDMSGGACKYKYDFGMKAAKKVIK